MKKYKTMLTIAGSDSIGGAGIQADIKTASAIGVYSMSVITAVTAQNTTGVKSYDPVTPHLLEAQLTAVLDDVEPDAVKIGMLPTVESVDIVTRSIVKYNLKNIVADPVCVATSGDSLAAHTVPEALVLSLFQNVDLITPNIPEAEVFLTRIITGSLDTYARELSQRIKAKAVLLKGGHLVDNTYSEDILYFDKSIFRFRTPRIETVNTHGTGCTLSSAIASFLALGFSIPEAVEKAKKWIYEAIKNGAEYEFGHGHGPVNHFFNNQK